MDDIIIRMKTVKDKDIINRISGIKINDYHQQIIRKYPLVAIYTSCGEYMNNAIYKVDDQYVSIDEINEWNDEYEIFFSAILEDVIKYITKLTTYGDSGKLVFINETTSDDIKQNVLQESKTIVDVILNEATDEVLDIELDIDEYYINVVCKYPAYAVYSCVLPWQEHIIYKIDDVYVCYHKEDDFDDLSYVIYSKNFKKLIEYLNWYNRLENGGVVQLVSVNS